MMNEIVHKVNLNEMLFFMGLSPLDLKVYLFLKVFDKDLQDCSAEEIAEFLEISLWSFRKSVKNLETGNNRFGISLLYIIPRYREDGGQYYNKYSVFDICEEYDYNIQAKNIKGASWKKNNLP